MKLLSRHVLFFCDDCDLLAPAITSFTSVYKFHTVITSSDEQDFLKKVYEYSPELLLIYLNDPEREHFSLIKAVRESPKLSTVPLIVYKNLPGPNELVDTFKRFVKIESDK